MNAELFCEKFFVRFFCGITVLNYSIFFAKKSQICLKHIWGYSTENSKIFISLRNSRKTITWPFKWEIRYVSNGVKTEIWNIFIQAPHVKLTFDNYNFVIVFKKLFIEFKLANFSTFFRINISNYPEKIIRNIVLIQYGPWSSLWSAGRLKNSFVFIDQILNLILNNLFIPLTR